MKGRLFDAERLQQSCWHADAAVWGDAIAIQEFASFDFVNGDISHRVFRKGEGPGVVIIHELPGMTTACISLAEAVANTGFCVHLPLLFGTPGDDRPIAFTAKLCISREFRVFSKKGGSPIVEWLRALCRKIKADCEGPGVGAIGLCLTGNFAIALMADSVLAPVASEPALPLFSLTKSAKAAIAVTDDEFARAQARSINGVPLIVCAFLVIGSAHQNALQRFGTRLDQASAGS